MSHLRLLIVLNNIDLATYQADCHLVSLKHYYIRVDLIHKLETWNQDTTMLLRQHCFWLCQQCCSQSETMLSEQHCGILLSISCNNS